MKYRLFSFLIAYKLYNKISIFNPKILNYLKFKLIVIFILIVYLIFFILFLYFSYKSYLYALKELSHKQANRSFNDLSFLISELPLVKGKYNPISMEAIKILVDTNQINHYSNYIYPINPEIYTLHQVLSINSEHASRFSAFVIDQMTQFNSNEF